MPAAAASYLSDESIVSRDAEEVTAFLTRNIAPKIIRPVTHGEPIVFNARYLVGDGFFASRASIDNGLDIKPLTELDMVMVFLGRSGSMQIETPQTAIAAADDLVLVSATRTVKRVILSAGREETVIAVGADHVRERMRAMLGFDVGTPFDFQLALDAASPLGSALFGFGSTLQWALAGDPLLQSSPIGLRRCKDIFVDLMLHAFGTERLLALAGPPLSGSMRQVRHAEEFMRASGHEPIGIADVARHVGVTTRTLQYAFRQQHNTTPLAVLQQIRLEGFRKDLQIAATEPVATVAARWGFTHLGRLAKQYRAAFGEKPVQTAMRARRSR